MEKVLLTEVIDSLKIPRDRLFELNRKKQIDVQLISGKKFYNLNEVRNSCNANVAVILTPSSRQKQNYANHVT